MLFIVIGFVGWVIFVECVIIDRCCLGGYLKVDLHMAVESVVCPIPFVIRTSVAAAL